MSKKLNIDNPFFQSMNRLGDMILLNVMFVICCFPVITIGTSCTALYRMLFRMRRRESIYAVRDFWTAFKEEWKQSTVLWAAIGLAGMILAVDLYITGRMQGSLWTALGIGAGVLFLLWAMTVSYVFAVEARFTNTAANQIKNSFLMACRHIWITVPLVLINAVLPVCLIVQVQLFGALVPLYLVAGFGLTGYLKVLLLERVFARYEG
jgi:uncharacterized membrane protein YesL